MANLFLPSAGCFPNPFSATISIISGVCANGVDDGATHTVTLKITNLSGQTVKTGLSTGSVPGVYRGSWDGTDNNGNPVANAGYNVILTDALDSQSLSVSITKAT
jgi:flagellar hook assembly protein FlgD